MNPAETYPAVVVPVYREDLPVEEWAALTNNLDKLAAYDCYLVGPKGMDYSNYTARWPEIRVCTFAEMYFKDLTGYNRLMVSIGFYRAFSTYSHILICQTDAFVFSDELMSWCDRGYDYVGAPVHDILPDKFSERIPVVTLNGGFSLRKVGASLKVLSSFRTIYSFRDIFRANLMEKGWKGILPALYFYFFGNNTFHLFNRYDRNEDIFWAIKVPEKFTWFHAPLPVDSAFFAADNKPERTLALTAGQLPFGCHAYQTHPDTWKAYIPDICWKHPAIA
ncbi:MAG: hypothetical protein H6585_01265 [Flavobacteriales bacterium]|nr:hypothetical protein [Flavobacteriales bacterium]